MTQIWAHRGARREQPENTLEAYAAAIDAGADGIELDVHLSKDGVPVLRHDAHVRTPDGRRVLLRRLTSDEIATLDVGDAEHGPRRIPTLAEAYALIARTDLVLNVEIKAAAVPYDGIEDLALDLWRRSGMGERVVHSSFDHHLLLALRERDPAVDVAPLYEEAMVAPWEYAARLGVTAMHPSHLTLRRPGELEGFAAAGIRVRPWTVNRAEDQERLIRAGVDAIVVDEPRAAVALRDRLDPPTR